MFDFFKKKKVNELQARINQLEESIRLAHYYTIWDIKPSNATKLLREAYEAQGKCLHQWERKVNSDTWTCSKCQKQSTDPSIKGAILHDKINFFERDELHKTITEICKKSLTDTFKRENPFFENFKDEVIDPNSPEYQEYLNSRTWMNQSFDDFIANTKDGKKNWSQLKQCMMPGQTEDDIKQMLVDDYWNKLKSNPDNEQYDSLANWLYRDKEEKT